MANASTSQGTPLSQYEASEAAADAVLAQAMAAAQNAYETSCNAAVENDEKQDDQAEETETSAIASAEQTESDQLASDESQRETTEQGAAYDQAATDQNALAAQTMANQNAQAAYDTAHAQAVSAYQNALSQADTTWADEAADAVADAEMDGLNPEDANFSEADAARQLAYANAKITFATSVGNARIAQAQAVGAADVAYATAMGNAETTANSAFDAADTTAVNGDAGAANTESQSVVSAVLRGTDTIAADNDSLTKLLDGYAVTEVTSDSTATVAREKAFGMDDGTYQVAVAEQQEQQQAAQAASSGSAADQFQTQEDQQWVNWLSGVAPAFVTDVTSTAQAEADDLDTNQGSLATEDGADADANLAFTQGGASLQETETTSFVQDESSYDQGLVGRDNTWSDTAASADSADFLGYANALSADLVANATAEKTYQVAVATAARNGLLPTLAGGLSPSGVASAMAAAAAQQTISLWNAEISLVTGDANADLAWVDSMADDTSNLETQDSTASKNLSDQSAELDKSRSDGLIPLETAYESSVITAQVSQWDSEEKGGDTLNTALNSTESTFYAAEYSQDATSMQALDNAEPSPWMQYEAQLAAAQQSWWSSQQSQDAQFVTDENNADDAYESTADSAYQTLSSTASTAASTQAQALDGAVLTQENAVERGQRRGGSVGGRPDGHIHQERGAGKVQFGGGDGHSGGRPGDGQHRSLPVDAERAGPDPRQRRGERGLRRPHGDCAGRSDRRPGRQQCLHHQCE